MVQCTNNMWRQNIDAIKWLIEPWFGAQTICEGLNIDAIKWLIKPWFSAQTICGGLNIDAIKWLIELWFGPDNMWRSEY